MDRKCGCKGIRSCRLCEKAEGTKEMREKLQTDAVSFVFCLRCRSVYEGWEVALEDNLCPTHFEPPSIPQDFREVLSGIELIEDFVTSDEEMALLSEMDQFPWAQSQSGRVKQDFGPKVNFKKQKIRMESFKGFPKYINFVKERLGETQSLRDFQPVELCNLRYEPERGSSIDPHLDDSWLWGPRLVTLNLASSTALTLLSPAKNNDEKRIILRMALPGRSLLILSGLSRNLWEHAIMREDIKSLRVASTWRELSSEFVSGGMHESLGASLLDRAKQIIDTPTTSN